MICIGILGMFFLTGIYTVSAVTTIDNEPDFIVDVLKSSYNPEMGGYVLVEISISNIGASVEEPTLVKVRLDLDGNEEEGIFPYEGTGPSESIEILMQYDEGTSPHTLTAIVDPDNEILEDSDGGEDNNVKSITLKSKVRPIISNIIENFLDRFDWPFPIIRVLLWAMSY